MRTTAATDATMIAAPAKVNVVTASSRIAQPSAMATTGLT